MHLVASLLLIMALSFFSACDRRPAEISFYYWKTGFALNSEERQALTRNDVRQLYVRYFDVVTEGGRAVPAGVLAVDSFPRGIDITPVIFIRNAVFKTAADSLPGQVLRLVNVLSKKAGRQPRAIQFDCDWTDATQGHYFRFLRRFKAMFPHPISATIRLHQVKYKERTGIPPVDHGVLMYYNMGPIGGLRNSIYDRDLARRYTAYLKAYPLRLDLALPVFGWSIQMRGGRVVALLNKMRPGHFSGDTAFSRQGDALFLAKHSIFKGGYYIRQGDVVKCEIIDEQTLRSMAGDLRDKFREAPREIIFYDLDAPNLASYHDDTFKELAGALR